MALYQHCIGSILGACIRYRANIYIVSKRHQVALYRLDIRCIVYDTAPISILWANNIRPIYKLYYSIVSALYRFDIKCTVYTILGQYPYCVQTIITQYWANTCMYRKRIPIQYRANFTLFPGNELKI